MRGKDDLAYRGGAQTPGLNNDLGGYLETNVSRDDGSKLLVDVELLTLFEVSKGVKKLPISSQGGSCRFTVEHIAHCKVQHVSLSPDQNQQYFMFGCKS